MSIVEGSALIESELVSKVRADRRLVSYLILHAGRRLREVGGGELAEVRGGYLFERVWQTFIRWLDSLPCI